MQIEQRVEVVEVVALGTEPPVILDGATPLRDVLGRMRDERSGCALITRDGSLAGIFTERDVASRVVGVRGALDQPVSDWMTPDPERVAQNDPIRKAILLMQRGGFRNVPIVDEANHVVGCVRHKDIINYLAEHYPEQLLNLPPDPDNQALAREGG